MATPLTVEALLEIVGNCRRSISLGGDGPDVPEWQRSGESMDVIDANEFDKQLQAILDSQPKKVFANLIGLTYREAMDVLEARSPYEKSRFPVKDIIGRTQSGFGIHRSPGDLVVSVALDTGAITDILALIA